MANKKKSGAKKEKNVFNPDERKTMPNNAAKVTPFSNSQLTALILLSMGISRIMQVRASYAAESTPICVEHLGDDACTNATILSLLSLKYHTAVSTTLLVFSVVVLQCWNFDSKLSEVNSLFILSPMASGIAALTVSESIQAGAVRKHAMMCLVLCVLAFPRRNIPFSGKRVSPSIKSLPSMVLAGLALTNLATALNYAYTGLSNDSISFFSQMMIIHPNDAPTTAAAPIILFLGVDALTSSLMYAFSWHSLSDAAQRATLINVACFKVYEYFYQIPSLSDDSFVQIDLWKTAVLTTAFVAGVAWIAPEISFKKKPS